MFMFVGGNQDGKFSVGFRDGIVRTVVGLDRETQAAYTMVIEAIGVSHFIILSSVYHLSSKQLIFLYDDDQAILKFC